MTFDWDDKKDGLNTSKGRPSFQEVVVAIGNGMVTSDIENPIHPGQWLLVVEINGYAHVVPYEVRGEKIRLITVFPSRKANRRNNE